MGDGATHGTSKGEACIEIDAGWGCGGLQHIDLVGNRVDGEGGEEGAAGVVHRGGRRRGRAREGMVGKGKKECENGARCVRKFLFSWQQVLHPVAVINDRTCFGENRRSPSDPPTAGSETPTPITAALASSRTTA